MSSSPAVTPTCVRLKPRQVYRDILQPACVDLHRKTMKLAIAAVFVFCIFLALPEKTRGQDVADVPAPSRPLDHGPEKMVVIDAATRQKQREKERAQNQHDKTFDGSLIDMGVDVMAARSSPQPVISSTPKATATAAPKVRATATPNLTLPQSDFGKPISLSLDATAAAKAPGSPAASPTPTATASPAK
jgi:hypothetical protein